MKFSSETVQILKNFSSINKSILFEEGNVIRTISEARTVMATATVPDSFPVSFAIYELPRFLSVLSLFDNPDIECTTEVVTIRSNHRTVNYTCTDPIMIVAPPKKALKLPPNELTCQLTNEQLDSLMKAASVLKLPEIAIIGNGEVVSFSALNSSNPTGDVYSVEVDKTEKDFEIYLKTSNMLIMSGNYVVEISPSVIHFVGQAVEYFIAAEQHSRMRLT